jgi:hypothetical protein
LLVTDNKTTVERVSAVSPVEALSINCSGFWVQGSEVTERITLNDEP